jgi:hypothetical protein
MGMGMPYVASIESARDIVGSFSETALKYNDIMLAIIALYVRALVSPKSITRPGKVGVPRTKDRSERERRARCGRARGA